MTVLDRGIEAWRWTLAPPRKQVTTAVDAELPVITTDDDLDGFLFEYFGVTLPNVQCCPTHSTPWAAFHDAYFARSTVAVWKASRGFGGKSFTLALLALTEALTLRADVNVLGGSGEQSKRVLESIAKLWDSPRAPRDLLKSEPTAQRQVLKWGNRVVALLASQASVRGPHPQRLRCDEIDEMNVDILNAALGQPMSKGWIQMHTVLASTHQWPDGTMTQVLKRVTEPGWKLYEWCWKETSAPHGWLTVGDIARKRQMMSARHWEVEVDLQEPSSEGRAIVTDRVEAAFTLGGEEEPDSGGRYGTGADWGRKVDWTFVVTIRSDCSPARVVKAERTQRVPWPDMVKILDDRLAAYGGTAAHDATGGGDVVASMIHGDVEPFIFVGRAREDLLSNYINAIEHGELIWAPSETNEAYAAAFSEHKYATVDDIYGRKAGGKLPDSIAAGALAWRAASTPLSAGYLEPPKTTPPRGRMWGAGMGIKPRQR